MTLPSKELIRELSSVHTPPCLSVYLPTHRSHPDNTQDPIRYQNLINDLEKSLLQTYSVGEVEIQLAQLKAVIGDRKLWNNTLDGMALFSAGTFFRQVSLPLRVPELAVAADSFHTKPLRHYLQTGDRFQILGLSRDKIQLFEGNRHTLTQITPHAEIPTTIQEALGEELTEKHITVASYGGVGGAMYHGHGSKKEETDTDTERFFRVVADAVYEYCSKPSELPLLLAALPEHHSLFRKVNKNPYLIENAISFNPEAITHEKLKQLAWEAMEPEYERRIENLTDAVAQAMAHQKGSVLLDDVVAAATAGQIETLLIEANRSLPGKITNDGMGRIQSGELPNPETDDVLDDVAEIVEQNRGKVIVIPAAQMPSKTGVAAIYRY